MTTIEPLTRLQVLMRKRLHQDLSEFEADWGEEERRRKKNKAWLLSVALVLLAVGGIFAYVLVESMVR